MASQGERLWLADPRCETAAKHLDPKLYVAGKEASGNTAAIRLSHLSTAQPAFAISRARRSDAGVIAVVGVLIAEGRHNPAYDPIWEHLPKEKGGHESVAELTIDLEGLLPKRRLAFRYNGSFTTPPCSEGVRWFVLAEPVELSAEQIAGFAAIYDHNNRPTQPLRGRSLVLEKVE
jgi:hypothetical protein